MTTILSGQFDDFERAEMVASDLRLLGFGGDDIEQFALNAPGQHDRHPLGGDEDADRQARDGDEGAVAGAAMGGAAGLALGAVAIPVVGPLAAAAGLAVGAYTGSLAGAVNTMGEDETPARARDHTAAGRRARRGAGCRRPCIARARWKRSPAIMRAPWRRRRERGATARGWTSIR